MPSSKKRHCKTLVMQLAQVQALEAQLITKAFKATLVQSLNIETYLTPIELELDKKVHQIAVCLYSGSFYSTIT